MNAFDSSIIYFLNSFSRKSWTFDYTVLFVANSTFVRAGLITFMLVWLWFRIDRNLIKTRESIISTVFFTLVALVFVKVFRYFLPFRPRPLHNPDLILNLPFGVDSSSLYEWSAFPSDTAAFFFAMSTGLFFISRLLGTPGNCLLSGCRLHEPNLSRLPLPYGYFCRNDHRYDIWVYLRTS
jgi:undecaprenyl-diphosphatase